MSDIYFKRDIFEIREKNILVKDEVLEILNTMIYFALQKRSSDIHLESLEDYIRIRVRIDGVLFEYKKIDKNIGSKLMNKIKILTELDIGEKRLPQDGRFKGVFKGEKLDFRVSIVPTIFGEKFVIRILKNRIGELDINSLGFSEENKKILFNSIEKKSGFLLFCGPTGSGKTTTLYSLINCLNKEGLNITTIEDPIEYQLNGINQIQCKNDIGLNFSKILRSVLRQDPDVILIGEIRDKETAEIALMASLTGHLVLSTIHTRNSLSAIDRLVAFGIDPYVVSEGLTLIQSQRLIRKLCSKCLGISGGCESCNNGFLGREAIEEIVVMDDNIREKIHNKKSLKEIGEYLKKIDFISMHDYALVKVSKGITTESEILKECIL